MLVETAREILRAHADPDRVERAWHWSPSDVHRGNAGVALAFGRLHRADPDGGWDRVAHPFIARAASHLHPDQLGLFDGLAGTAFVLRFLGQGGRRYVEATASVETLLLTRTRHLLDSLPDAARLVREYDLTSGLAGIGGVLLAIPAARGLLVDLLDRLTRWTAAGFHAGFEPDQHTVNLGLAHGIPGPLALFALASRAGVECEEWVAHELATRLVTGIVPTDYGPDLPLMLPSPTPEPSRIGWCYGNIGAARALQLAGDAFGQPAWTATALALLRSGLARVDDPVSRIEDAALCHGTAGLLHVVGLISADAGNPPDLVAAHAALANRLLAEPVPDAPGLLVGATGVALALLSAAGPIEGTDWDRTLLVS